MDRHLKVLVTGGTGRQGAAVAQWLLSSGHDVIAVTRNLADPAAMRLMRRGARLAWATFDDRTTLEENAQACDAMFLVTTAEQGVAEEERQGRQLVDIAAAAGLRHVVYSSVPAGPQAAGLPHVDSKRAVEQHLAELAVPHTVIAPAFFMENFTDLRPLERFREGRLALPWPAGAKLQQIAVADLAKFVTLVLEDPEPYLGQRVAIAGDELTGIEMAAALARVIGRPVSYEEQSLEAAWAEEAPYAPHLEAIRRDHSGIDVSRLRALYDFGWHTLDGWARLQPWTDLLGPLR